MDKAGNTDSAAETMEMAAGGYGEENLSGDRIRDRISGDMVLYLYDRQDRISDRLNRKIERLDHRLKVLEERGREQ